MQLKFQKRPQTLLNFPRKNPSQTNQGTNIGHVLLKLNKESMPIAPPVKCCYLFRKKHTSSGGIAVSSALYELLKVCEVMNVFPYFKRGCALCLKRRVDTTSQGWSVIDVSIGEYNLCIGEVNPMSQGKVNPTSLGSVPYVSSECTLCLKERSLCLG